jgi:hypothetical protein
LGVGLTTPPREKNLCSVNLRDASDGIDKQTTTQLQRKGDDFWNVERANIIQDWSTAVFAVSVKRITAIQETRWQDKDIKDMKSHMLSYSGKEEEK